MWLKVSMGGEHHRYYKHTKFHQNPRGDPKFLVDLTQNDPYVTATPFFPDTGCVQNTYRTCLKCVQDASGTCANVTLKLYRILPYNWLFLKGFYFRIFRKGLSLKNKFPGPAVLRK